MHFFSGASRDALKKPRFGITPVAFHRAGSNVEQFRDFAFLEPDEEPELYHFRLVGRQRSKFIQRRIDLQETVVVGRRLDLDVVRIDTRQLGAVPCALLFPGAFDQNMAHRLSGGRVEMFAALPLHRLAALQSKPGLVNQRRGLERLTGGLRGHLCHSQFAEFIVNQWQKFLSRLWIPLLDAIEDLRHVAHETERYRKRTGCTSLKPSFEL